MTNVWPYDAYERLIDAAFDPMRPFRCAMLMPFDRRFDQVAELIESTVNKTVTSFEQAFSVQQPITKRLDWVNASGAIHQQIWQEIFEADLVFCDLTGYNPNVMFEAGVAACWKQPGKVVFVKDRFYRQPSAFDLEPMRYTEYELTADGIEPFKGKVSQHVIDALIPWPDRLAPSTRFRLPLKVDFSSGRDDLRIYTPPFAHRRVTNGALEFGSIMFYPHSWASLGSQPFAYFELDFHAAFHRPLPVDKAPKIGVALRSQHFYANFGHHVSLAGDGTIWITIPDESHPNLYTDLTIRQPTPISLDEDHHFNVRFGRDFYTIRVDDFTHTISLDSMPKVLPPGPIRLQSARSLMALKRISLKRLPNQLAGSLGA